MNPSADLTELLTRQSAILLDFDGPVCSIFANHPAPAVAAKLRDTLADAGVAIPAEVEGERDPLEVPKWAATLGQPQLVRKVETVLCAEEAEAARTSAPTPFGREFVVGAYEAGKPLAVVSNNPNPEPILTAAKALSADPADCVLIGDSLTDIDGAHAVGVAVVGYANHPEKVEPFAAAGAEVIITTMADAALALAEMKL